jgi:hypothetical protein
MLTIVALVNRETALRGVVKILEKIGATEKVIHMSSRHIELLPFPPPGSDTIVTSR